MDLQAKNSSRIMIVTINSNSIITTLNLLHILKKYSRSQFSIWHTPRPHAVRVGVIFTSLLLLHFSSGVFEESSGDAAATHLALFDVARVQHRPGHVLQCVCVR